MKRLIIVFACAAALTLEAVQYSKLAIIVAAKQCGRWTRLKTWIEGAGYADEWQAAAFFADTYPAFAQITNAVVASGIATPAEVDAILAAARDTAPDALLPSAYARDMLTKEGRKRWHGEFRSRFETNAVERTIRRIDTYDDGYEHVEPGAGRKYLTPEEEAERAARRKDTGSLDERIARLQQLIAELEAKRRGATNEVDAAYATIKIAAKRKIVERLEASRTNVVDVVVVPEGN